ncbi:hypothetical protein KR200_003133, partial [Drosophila serrata]
LGSVANQNSNTMEGPPASACLIFAALALGSIVTTGAVQGGVFKELTTPLGHQIMRLAKSAEMRSFIDASVDPCDDFYGYACGNYVSINAATPDKDTNIGQVMFASYLRRARQILNQPRMSSDRPMETRVKYFYESCLDTSSLRTNQRSQLLNVLREFGGMPAVEGSSWDEFQFDPIETMAQLLRRYGKLTLLGVYVAPDFTNSQINRLYLGQRDDLAVRDEATSLAKKVELKMRLQDQLGLSEQLARKTAIEIIDLEAELSRSNGLLSGRSSGKSLDEQLTLYTMDELQQKYGDHLNFTEFFGLVLGEEHVPDKLYVNDEEFLDNALLTMRSTALATQANFVLWNLLQDYLVDSKPNDLAKWCTEQTKKYFGPLGEHMVYERYRSPDSEAEIKRIWNEVRGIFMEHLRGDKLDWITNATRQLAIEKLSHMQLHINSYDNENFEELYGELVIDGLNYVTNLQQVRIGQGKRNFKSLDQPARSLEAMEILGFTPAYNILENNITIPVALLQPRYFWGDQYPEALKYATLGYLLAHEMLHGFDDDGRKYDAAGNFAPWWDIRSTYEFEERRKCFQAQYHEYKYGGSKLPESREQSENIADNGGIKLAFKAYQRWLASQTEEVRQRETLEGLSFNGEQLFFVGYAQLWCDDVHSLFKSTFAQADNHAPSMYRVIGSLSNFQEFSWVFNCSQTAPMDPEYKCAIY